MTDLRPVGARPGFNNGWPRLPETMDGPGYPIAPVTLRTGRRMVFQPVESNARCLGQKTFASPRPTSQRLLLSARGCRPAATPGTGPKTDFYPERVAFVSVAKNVGLTRLSPGDGSNPYRIEGVLLAS